MPLNLWTSCRLLRSFNQVGCHLVNCSLCGHLGQRESIFWGLPILLLWGLSGINCMSGWLADCELFTMIPTSCKLFCTAAAMVLAKFANQSAFTLLAPCATRGFAPVELCEFSRAAECAISWLKWGLFPSTRLLWVRLCWRTVSSTWKYLCTFGLQWRPKRSRHT